MQTRGLFLAILMLSSAALAAPVDVKTDPISGVVTDVQTGKPVANAVVHLTWIAHPVSSEAGNVLLSSRGVLSLELVTDRAGRFMAKTTKLDLPQGYELTRDLDPMITIYASGYRRARFPATALAARDPETAQLSRGIGKALLIEPLSNEADPQFALEREMVLWRQDIDQRRDPGNWVSGAAMHRSSQKRLVALFKSNCERVRMEQRADACSLSGSGAPQLIAPSEHASTPGAKAASTTKNAQVRARDHVEAASDAGGDESPRTTTVGIVSRPSVQEIEASPGKTPK